jgi:hypothetical protein
VGSTLPQEARHPRQWSRYPSQPVQDHGAFQNKNPRQAQERGTAGQLILDTLNSITGFWNSRRPQVPLAEARNDGPQHQGTGQMGQPARRQGPPMTLAEMVARVQQSGGGRADLCSDGCDVGGISLPKLLYKVACVWLSQKTCCACKTQAG